VRGVPGNKLMGFQALCVPLLPQLVNGLQADDPHARMALLQERDGTAGAAPYVKDRPRPRELDEAGQDVEAEEMLVKLADVHGAVRSAVLA